MSTPPLVLAAHGTRSRLGRERVRALRSRVQHLAPSREVLLGHVDVEEPTLEEVVHAASAPPLVIPLFLAAGLHVRTDVTAAARSRPGTQVAPFLGSHPVILDELARQVTSEPTTSPQPNATQVALVAAGSSDPRARAGVVALAAALSQRTSCPVEAAFLSGPGPQADEVVPRSRLAVALLLAPGHFATRLESVGRAHGIRSTPPLLAHDASVDAIARSLLE